MGDSTDGDPTDTDREQRPKNQLAKDEILLTHYTVLREELRKKNDYGEKRITRGIASAAVVTGYAFYDEAYIVLSVIPVIIAVLAITQVYESNWGVRLARHIDEIQNEIDVEFFCWERKHGIGNRFDAAELIPLMSLGLVVFIIYAVSILLSMEYIERETPVQLYAFTLTARDFLYGYGVLTLFVLLSLGAFFIIYVRMALGGASTSNP